ncbi:MAG: TolC family protein [Chryseobacterium sp.]|nr:MAG: TolC family protein [Chryseobacterium sp.]
MKKLTLLFFLIFTSSTMSAQNFWSLKDCITYGLKFSKNNLIADNNIKLAEAISKESRAAYLPSITLNGSLDNNLKVQESIIPAGVIGPDEMRVSFTKKFSSTATILLDQVIYDRSLLVGLKANRINKQSAEISMQRSEELLIYNISSAYYQVMVYRQQVAQLKLTQEIYNQQIKILQVQVQKGVTLQADVDKVKVSLNNTMSQTSLAENNLFVSENQLKNTMGLSIDSAIHVEEIRAEIEKEAITTSINVPRFEANNRTDYQLSQLDYKLLEIEEKKIKASALPRLKAYAQYGYNGFGDQLSPALNDLNSFSTIGLKISVPVFDLFKRNALAGQAKYKRLNASQNIKMDQDRFLMEFENAKTKLIKSQHNLQNDKSNVALARSVFSVADLQFKKGVTGLIDWLNAQTSLKEAENNYLISLYSSFMAKIELEKANGSLKTFHNSL